MIGLLLIPPGVRAEVGVGPRSILLGQSAAFSGPSGALGREFREGAHQVFDQVNAQGGILGRQIVMVYRDDRYEPALARRNTQRLIAKDKVFALFGYVGTPTVKAALPLIVQAKVPLVAPLTGAQLIRSPNNPLVFNIRSSYHQEIEAIVRYLLRYRRRSIAIVYQNDAEACGRSHRGTQLQPHGGSGPSGGPGPAGCGVGHLLLWHRGQLHPPTAPAGESGPGDERVVCGQQRLG
ncbi:MAG: ABC transporter substrate-binding protein [Cyanobium sp.]